jgi:hypothetical protein
MIMAHDIIPHNHQENDFCKLSGHLQPKAIPHEFHDQFADHHVCKASRLLFHHFSQDGLFLENNNNDYSFCESRKEMIAENQNRLFNNNSHYGPASRRAPPAI